MKLELIMLDMTQMYEKEGNRLLLVIMSFEYECSKVNLVHTHVKWEGWPQLTFVKFAMLLT